jgi:hypothetical protein
MDVSPPASSRVELTARGSELPSIDYSRLPSQRVRRGGSSAGWGSGSRLARRPLVHEL